MVIQISKGQIDSASSVSGPEKNNDSFSGEFQRGRIIRAVGGFFDVLDLSGEMVRCFGRGRLKNRRQTIIPGDLVEFNYDHSGQGVVSGVLPREVELRRPPVANLEQLIVVASARDPEIDWVFLSRQLLLATAKGLDGVICLNKTDLIKSHELAEIENILSGFPYPKIYTSVIDNKGISKLEVTLKDRISVLSGSSGVGKSSLINAVQPGLDLTTGEVSLKKKSGRHTTRQVELLVLDNGGIVFDTPGFSRVDLELEEQDEQRLDKCFPEILKYSEACRFRNCMHRNEPDCAVRVAVENNHISNVRYKHYIILLKEWEKEEWN